MSGMSSSCLSCLGGGLLDWVSGSGVSGAGDCGSAGGWLSLPILREVGGCVLINGLLGSRGLSSSSV